MFLILNKTSKLNNALLVDTGGKIIKETIKRNKSDILTVIDRTLKNTKSIQDLDGIIVVLGSDTFSISRSVVAIANGLSLAWNLPVVGIDRKNFTNEKELIEKSLKKIKKFKIGKFVLPIYGNEPNITTI